MKEGRRPRRPGTKMVAGLSAAGGDAGPPYVAFGGRVSRVAAGGDAGPIVVAFGGPGASPWP
jgi:hypothetical protein